MAHFEEFFLGLRSHPSDMAKVKMIAQIHKFRADVADINNIIAVVHTVSDEYKPDIIRLYFGCLTTTQNFVKVVSLITEESVRLNLIIESRIVASIPFENIFDVLELLDKEINYIKVLEESHRQFSIGELTEIIDGFLSRKNAIKCIIELCRSYQLDLNSMCEIIKHVRLENMKIKIASEYLRALKCGQPNIILPIMKCFPSCLCKLKFLNCVPDSFVINSKAFEILREVHSNHHAQFVTYFKEIFNRNNQICIPSECIDIFKNDKLKLWVLQIINSPSIYNTPEKLCRLLKMFANSKDKQFILDMRIKLLSQQILPDLILVEYLKCGDLFLEKKNLALIYNTLYTLPITFYAHSKYIDSINTPSRKKIVEEVARARGFPIVIPLELHDTRAHEFSVVCVLCKQNVSRITYECGHLCTCYECTRWVLANTKVCPICQVGFKKIYYME